MYCANCGIALPEGVRFCDSCGAAQRSSEERANAPRLPAAIPAADVVEEWEYCEIVYQAKAWSRDFIARATGRYGTHQVLKKGAGSSPKHDWVKGKIIKEMVDTLVQDGWEPQPKGSEWYSHRFRKRTEAR